MIKDNGKMTSGSHSYPELLLHFLPRPIQTEAQYDTAVRQLNELIDQGNLSDEEQDVLTLLGTLIMAYEEDHYPDEMFELRGRDLLNTLLDEAGLATDELLPVFKTRSRLEAVLRGEQPLSEDLRNGLAAFFDVPAALFYEPVEALTA
jgi:HTH-type transcriptional regulator / antitoxin HigA